ncbi:hypothetical protein PoB_003541200 [Plakobranchus ocellatus]|uniref:Uncharacterized protein n=1 Tax=Plakobranchus ocellatus TaxID=259542 RepID=A0AAV4APR7_9GAST|nr:hypothetical protein PoB_003541200 [Plakobranchus ocellatus]
MQNRILFMLGKIYLGIRDFPEKAQGFWASLGRRRWRGGIRISVVCANGGGSTLLHTEKSSWTLRKNTAGSVSGSVDCNETGRDFCQSLEPASCVLHVEGSKANKSHTRISQPFLPHDTRDMTLERKTHTVRNTIKPLPGNIQRSIPVQYRSLADDQSGQFCCFFTVRTDMRVGSNEPVKMMLERPDG